MKTSINKAQIANFHKEAQRVALEEDGDLNTKEGYLEELYDALSAGDYVTVAALAAIVDQF